MNATRAAMSIIEWGRQEHRCVFSYGELARLFGRSRQGRALENLVRTLVALDVLERAGRDVYVVSPLAREGAREVLDQIALVAGGYNVVVESLETAASRWGIISQKYARLATYVTTGRSRSIECSFGTVVLVHTAWGTGRLVRQSIDRGAGLTRLSDKQMTVHMLKRTGRASELLREWEAGDGQPA